MNTAWRQILALVTTHSPRVAIYLAAAGMFGLGVSQCVNGDADTGSKNILHALGMLGVGHIALAGVVTTPAPEVKQKA